MLRILSLAAVAALAGPAGALADSVYYSKPGVIGIQSVSGKIVEESGLGLEIVTEDGNTILIPKADVYQVIRNDPTAAGPSGLDPLGPRSEARRSRFTHHVGIKGGMNIANMAVDPGELEEGDSLQSYALGAWWGVPLTRRLTIQTEAFYSVKGDAETAGGYTASTRMGYLDVPVLAKIGFLHGAPARPSLFLGPSVAVNLSATSRLEGGDSDIEVDVNDQVRPLDFGLVVGGGVDIPVGERSFGLDLRYSKGLTNVAGESANGTAHNDVLAVMGSFGWQ